MHTLFLDIDGVINSISSRPPKTNTGWTGEWTEKRIEGFRILWSNELIDALNNLAARDDLQIIWHTDWRKQALVLAHEVGLPEFPYLDAPDDELATVSPWWKLSRVQDHWDTTTSEKTVWIDDSIAYDPASSSWCRTLDRALVIVPNSYHGLTKKHIQQINEFLDS